MADIANISGLKVGSPLLIPVVNASLEFTQKLLHATGVDGDLAVSTGVSQLALSAALHASTATLAMASVICTLDAPPSDVRGVPGPNGDLVLRCGHSPVHEFDFQDGRRL